MGRTVVRVLPALVGALIVVAGLGVGFGHGGTPVTAQSASFRIESPQASELTGTWAYVAPPVLPARVLVGDAREPEVPLFIVPGIPYPQLPVILDALNPHAPVVLPVVNPNGAMIQVRLGARRDAPTGYVSRDDVTVRSSSFTILVELGQRRISLWDGTRLLWAEPAAVGAGVTPTAPGDHFVEDSATLAPDDPAGVGRLVLGDFTSLLGAAPASAPLVIEGKGGPGQLGQAVTDGRVLVSDDVVSQLVATALPGTPVQIVA